MKKIDLINWTDKKAKMVSSKIDSIEERHKKIDEEFMVVIKKIQSDNKIEISYDYKPEVYKP